MAMSVTSPGDSEPMLEINTTPLIDVMLVLLIVFIISLPIMTHAVKLDIQSSPGPATPRETINIEIEYGGALLWNGNVVDEAQLEQHFRRESRKQPQPDVRVLANSRSKYDTFAHVLAVAQRSGMKNIGVVGGE